MEKHFKQVENKLVWAEKKETDNFEEIQEFFEASKKAGCEGLMVKTLIKDSTYEPSKRTFKWLKMKKDYLDDLENNLKEAFAKIHRQKTKLKIKAAE